MISYQWIKLYIETLHDPKMGRLSDRLWRRAIECFMLAGELGNGGELPPIDKIAWTLRSSIEQLETEFFNLCEVGILSQIDGVYHVTSFNKRQAKIDGADRIKNWRDRQKKQEYYDGETEDVTDVKRECNDGVTSRYTDKIRIDKNRIDINAMINEIGEMAGTMNTDYYKDFEELFELYDHKDVMGAAEWAFKRKKLNIMTGSQAMWSALKKGWNRESTNKQREEQWSEIH